MRKVTIDEIDIETEGNLDNGRRSLTNALNMSDVAINYFTVEPGEVFAGGMHTHLDQEEIFYVLEGVATFATKETATEETTLVEIAAGEAIRFEPGEFQQGRNESDDPVVALAIGAPKNSTSGRIPRTCPECGESPYMDTVMRGGELMVQCPECDAIRDSGLH